MKALQGLSAEAWVAIATWALVLFTFLLALWGRRDARDQIEAMRQTAKAQVEAAQQATKEQMAITERMADTHIKTLQEDLKTRLLLHYETLWVSPEMIAHRKQLGDRLQYVAWGRNEADEIHKAVRDDAVPNFFESVGIHLQRGHLDTEMVSSIFGYYAMRYGQMLGPFFVRDGQVRGDEELWSGFLHLYHTLREFEGTKRGRPHPDFPGEEILRFVREEAGYSK